MGETRLPTVVCVDDDDAILSALSRCLRRDGLDVRTTQSPHDALAWLASSEVSVLVSDYEMPEMTGVQLCAQARRLRPETTRILLTGRRTLETAIDGINHGEIFRFISKPFENEQLRAAVLAGVRRHDELVALSGDRQRRERREALRAALEQEYPGISVVTRARDGVHEVADDPSAEAAALGLGALAAVFTRP
jgi:DNA-binding NtrC family response regulator